MALFHPPVSDGVAAAAGLAISICKPAEVGFRGEQLQNTFVLIQLGRGRRAAGDNHLSVSRGDAPVLHRRCPDAIHPSASGKGHHGCSVCATWLGGGHLHPGPDGLSMR